MSETVATRISPNLVWFETPAYRIVALQWEGPPCRYFRVWLALTFKRPTWRIFKTIGRRRLWHYLDALDPLLFVLLGRHTGRVAFLGIEAGYDRGPVDREWYRRKVERTIGKRQHALEGTL